MTTRASERSRIQTRTDSVSEATLSRPLSKSELRFPIQHETASEDLRNALQVLAAATGHEIDLFERWERNEQHGTQERVYRNAEVWELELEAVERRIKAALQKIEAPQRRRRMIGDIGAVVFLVIVTIAALMLASCARPVAIAPAPVSQLPREFRSIRCPAGLQLEVTRRDSLYVVSCATRGGAQ